MQLRTGLSHLQRLAAKFRAVESADCDWCSAIDLHLNESEPSRKSSPPVSHQFGPLNSAMLFEKGTDVLLGNAWT